MAATLVLGTSAARRAGSSPVPATMKKIRNLLLAMGLAVVMFVTGCGKTITSGQVIDHRFVAAYTDTTTTFMTVNDVMIPIITTNYYPDAWYLKVKDETGYEGWVKVTKETHDNLKNGDTWKRQ